MNLDALTIGEVKDLLQLLRGSSESQHTHSLCLGRQYLIRTVTHYYVGKLVTITDTDLVLQDASWVADTGRFSNALKTGTLAEVEPFVGPVIVSRAAIVDATEWNHPLPTEQI